MTKTWAKELGRKNINVNAVAPGFILTEMTRSMPYKIFGGLYLIISKNLVKT